MTDEKPKTPGMAEVSAKFEHEAGVAADSELLALRARVSEFYDIYAAATQASKEWITEKNRVEALPDAPPVDSPKFDGGAHDRWLADHGVTTLAKKSSAAWDRCGTAVNAVFDTPAHSQHGVVEKLKILRMALGDYPGDHDADEDLEAYQTTRPDKGPSWFELVIADFERLAEAPTPVEDPVLVLKREWEARYKALDENRDDPDADDSDKAVQPFFDRLHETETQILRAQATTPAGIAVKLILWARLHYDADEVSGLNWTRKSIKGHPYDLDRLPVMSALLDLERMAGGRAVYQPVPTDPETSSLMGSLDSELVELAAGIAALDIVAGNMQDAGDEALHYLTEKLKEDADKVRSRFNALHSAANRGTISKDPVVELGRNWNEVMAKRTQLKDRDSNDPKHPDVLEDERLHDVQLDIEEKIANTPTHAAAGVAVKLRQLERDDQKFDGMSSWRKAAFRTALEALARIAGGAKS